MVRQPNVRRHDQGSVLPLVLVLMVVAGLIVIPLLGYTVAVFRSNTAVSQRTGAVEAAKGGVRMAIRDAAAVFNICDGGGILTPPDPTINKIPVKVTCSELNEVGPLQALGFQVPIGAAAMQVGASVPPEFSGLPVSVGGLPPAPVQSPAVPPYPATPDWWTGQESFGALNNMIWTPHLPRLPSTPRSSTPFNMPPAFNCTVFFPGRYANPVPLTGNVYFTSGVYYFEKPVTILANANVVVGYGLQDLPNPDCSDDNQVVANVIGAPATYDIHGGGATWVFGKEGQLVVNDAAATTIRLIFNQRYDTQDRGGRISIMTVNGDDILVPTADHLVTNVNKIPVSKILAIVDEPEPVPDTWNPTAINGTLYAPSSSTYTDEDRPPLAPTGFTATHFQYNDGTAKGAILMTWPEVIGQTTGGALINGYTVTMSPTPPTSSPARCQANDLVFTGAPGSRTVSCLAKNLSLTLPSTGSGYTITVSASNEAGVGATAGGNSRPRASSPPLNPPVPPTNVAALGSDVDDKAQIRWNPSVDGGSPVTRYDVTAHRIFTPIQPALPPVTSDMNLFQRRDRVRVYGVPAIDPNGEVMSVQSVDTTGFPATVGTVTFSGLDVTISTTPGGSTGTYTIPYTVVANPSGAVASGLITINVSSSTPSDEDPVARSLPLAATVGVPIVSRVPVYDPDGNNPLVLTVPYSTTAFPAPQWTFAVNAATLEVAITTTAPAGTYTIPYRVRDDDGDDDIDSIVVTILSGDQVVTGGTCQATAPSPGLPVPLACEIALPDLPAADATGTNLGYRFDVVATNAIGSSTPGSNPAPYPLAFNGLGTALPPPGAPAVPPGLVPWIPTPIVQIITDKDSANVEVAIAGYVAVPMGRVSVQNTDGENIRIIGGVLAGTFDVVDGRKVDGLAGSLPIGFKNDIVLQRTVKIVSTARNITAIAVVQVNEDGARIRINSWVIQ